MGPNRSAWPWSRALARRNRQSYGGHSPQCPNASPFMQSKLAIARLLRDGEWRRGELNPRPRNLATRRLHA
jgi:hypothetical protein